MHAQQHNKRAAMACTRGHTKVQSWYAQYQKGMHNNIEKGKGGSHGMPNNTKKVQLMYVCTTTHKKVQPRLRFNNSINHATNQSVNQARQSKAILFDGNAYQSRIYLSCRSRLKKNVELRKYLHRKVLETKIGGPS